MAKKSQPKIYNYLETWTTRYGKSQRVVTRQGGRFVSNISLTAIKHGEKVVSR